MSVLLVVALAGFAAALGGYCFLTGGRGRSAPIPLSTRMRQTGVATALALVPLLFLFAGLSYDLNPLLEGAATWRGLVLGIGVVLILLGLRTDRRRTAAAADVRRGAAT